MSVYHIIVDFVQLFHFLLNFDCNLVMCSRRVFCVVFFFFSSRRRHTRFDCDWSSDVCSSDLVTSGRFSTGNNGEIFYSIVPDAAGTLSCAHSVTAVTQLVPVTFVHEFQHMISFNQHVLVHCTLNGCPAPPEDLSLNEGLSHYAEENGGRVFLPATANYCNYVFCGPYNAGPDLTAPPSPLL